MADRAELVWWQPVQAADALQASAWLPAALSITLDAAAGTCQVQEAASPAALPADEPAEAGSR